MAIATAPDLSSLKDKSIIVTGGASGLGRATATSFASAGAYVTVADVQETAGNSLVADLTSKGYRATFVHCDVSDWASATAAFKHAVNFSPRKALDVAALFAGVMGQKTSIADQIVTSNPSANLDKVPERPKHLAIDINLVGAYETAWLALYYMRLPPTGDVDGIAFGGGSTMTKSLVMVSSLGGYVDMPAYTDYNSSKFGVRGIFLGLRHNMDKIGVRLNLLAPHWVDTPMSRGNLEDMERVGLKPGAGITFVSIDHVVNAAGRCAADTAVNGRSFAIMPEGYVDLMDEESGNWGADVVRAQWKVRQAAGDVIGSAKAGRMA